MTKYEIGERFVHIEDTKQERVLEIIGGSSNGKYTYYKLRDYLAEKNGDMEPVYIAQPELDKYFVPYDEKESQSDEA